MADLSKFGVPLNGQNLGILQPKIMYRFRVIFNNFGQNNNLRELTQNVVSMSRPNLTHAATEIHSYNSVAYAMGKHSWDTVEVVLRDDITNSVVSAVGSQTQKQMNHFEQTSAVAGSNYKFDLELHSLDGTTADQLESWILDGCFLEGVKWPDGDYSSSDAQQVTLTIRFDNATQIAGPNTNNGTTVGGDPFSNEPSPTGGTRV